MVLQTFQLYTMYLLTYETLNIPNEWLENAIQIVPLL
jgi:hypothetical protein